MYGCPTNLAPSYRSQIGSKILQTLYVGWLELGIECGPGPVEKGSAIREKEPKMRPFLDYIFLLPRYLGTSYKLLPMHFH